MPSSKITSLWKLIESMQAKLETFGLDEDAVDAAVLIGLEALFKEEDAHMRRRPAAHGFSPLPIVAKA